MCVGSANLLGESRLAPTSVPEDGDLLHVTLLKAPAPPPPSPPLPPPPTIDSDNLALIIG